MRRIGGELLERARGKQAGILSGAFWSDKLMDFAMKDETFKVQLFRFVDTLPRLTTPEMVHDHLVDYLGGDVKLPPGLGAGLKAGGVFKGAKLNKKAHLITGVICGYRIEDIETPLTRQARYLDKLVDELAKGRKMEKILRTA